jgi:hypothetical protein
MLNLTHKVHHKIQVVQNISHYYNYNIQPIMFTATPEVRHDVCELTKSTSKVFKNKEYIFKDQEGLINKASICNKLLLSHSALAVVDPSNNKNLLVYVGTGQSADIRIPCTQYTGINKLEWQKIDPVTISYKNINDYYISPRPYSWRLGPNESLYDNKFVRVLNKGDEEFIKLHYDDLKFFNLHKHEIQQYLNLYSNLKTENKLVDMNGFEVLLTYNLLNYNKQVGIISPKNFIECMRDYEEYKEKYNLILSKCGADLGL